MSDHQKKGGEARAISLSMERRVEIARKAAETRWLAPRAAYEGDLHIGELTLPSAVLQDGRRVLISRAFLTALGRPWKGTYQRSDRPNFVDAKNLDQFITEEVREYLEPIEFRNLRGQKVQGYRAELLPLVCDVYLRARDAGELTESQRSIGRQSEILTRSLSKIGIVGLVDEATGYQSVRARDEVQRILAAYISEELLPWAKKFPDSFYEQIHRVWGWPYAPGNHKRTAYIGKLTNWLIYEQLPPGVLEELRHKNPRDSETGRRKTTHHRHLTEDVGHPSLEKQITSVTTLLRATPTNKPGFFKQLFNAAFPQDQGEMFPDFDPGENPKKRTT